ncbi:hypothetical protein [Methylobacterium haplocladii]|uniref:Uncharacterized protein n=1 Tax=Methylobacterium haplocladii TaxID=1176176 RepID=A0A512IKR7_9HYPH|nr:hypothetical protein [Methylobacterium haplocladii]GEO98265.1 hypothetical protein MHA02_06530 [Methylobacterium haplocladii]GJD84340.1 hypothetical protein HPGCJGGD_2216 [Methylobacterium haplocladii]GLS58441.1 hypothetical protein GCM10007887_11010 [Methylobacterium haplocladii]
MHSRDTQHRGALVAIEESIRETLAAQDQHMAAWDLLWKERVANSFAGVDEDETEPALFVQYGPEQPEVVQV